MKVGKALAIACTTPGKTAPTFRSHHARHSKFFHRIARIQSKQRSICIDPLVIVTDVLTLTAQNGESIDLLAEAEVGGDSDE
jgi:hypothetical protein